MCGTQEQPGANGAPVKAERGGEEPEGAPPAKKARTEAGTDGAEVRPGPAFPPGASCTRAVLRQCNLQEAAGGAADAPPAKKPRVEAGAEGAQARFLIRCLAYYSCSAARVLRRRARRRARPRLQRSASRVCR